MRTNVHGIRIGDQHQLRKGHNILTKVFVDNHKIFSRQVAIGYKQLDLGGHGFTIATSPDSVFPLSGCEQTPQIQPVC